MKILNLPIHAMGRWDLYPRFRSSLRSLFTKLPGRILLGCSGGPDSMALLDLLDRWHLETGCELLVAHVNHRLRGRSSDDDQLFVRREARGRHLPYVTASADTRRKASRERRGVEDAARRIRYTLLDRMAKREHCAFVLTAHTLDDQVETFFLNIIRGSGPRGLAAMAPISRWPLQAQSKRSTSPLLIRPLLGIRREDLRKYLRHRKIHFRQDASNRSFVFFRNRIRPVLQSWDRLRPGFFERLGQTCEILRDEEELWKEELERALPKVFRRTSGGGVLELGPLFRYHKAKQRRILSQLFPAAGFEPLEQLRVFATHRNQTGKLALPVGEAEKKKNRLFLRSAIRSNSVSRKRLVSFRPGFLRLAVPGRARVSVGGKAWRIHTRMVKNLPRNWKRQRTRVFADLNRLNVATLHVRGWRPGDWFHPLGMTGRKKLQDFFVDEGIPREERNRIPLLADKNGIVWVTGHRLSDTVRLTSSTRRIVELTVASNIS